MLCIAPLTYVSLTNSTIEDMSNNPVVSIPDQFAKQASGYVNDTTPPELEGFHLDMDDGILTLLYSETIDIFTSLHSFFSPICPRA